MSKGSKQRPSEISIKEFNDNFDRIFKGNKNGTQKTKTRRKNEYS